MGVDGHGLTIGQREEVGFFASSLESTSVQYKLRQAIAIFQLICFKRGCRLHLYINTILARTSVEHYFSLRCVLRTESLAREIDIHCLS